MRRWPVIGALLVACGGHPHTDAEDVVFSAVADAWQDAGLRDPYDVRDKRLEGFEIDVRTTVASFEGSCPPQWYKGEFVHAWACLRWRPETGKVRTISYPVAVISPLLPVDRQAAAAIHELCHAFRETAYRSADNLHTDGRVWETGGPDSVESTASRRAYGLPYTDAPTDGPVAPGGELRAYVFD